MKHSSASKQQVTSKVLGMAVALFLVLGFSSPSNASWFGSNSPAPLLATVDQLTAPLVAASPPSRISIPSISVDAKIVPVGIDPTTKSLVVPAQGSVVGWFSKGAKQRPTVLVGHVDTAKKAAVFYRLPKLRTGDSIRVTNSDDSVRRYRVERITRVGKNSFPTKSVYLGSGLRLITCGGKFDRKTGHYEDNIIVFAKAA
jgi:LPXTG-site transpeptidase (sortase) family protein